MALRVQVLRGYRGLLRAARVAFQSDNRTLVAFQQQLRQRFEQDRSIGEEEAKLRLREMKDVEEFMRSNLVQGRLNHRGNFGAYTRAGNAFCNCI
jgi:complex III assembly factor LYRM7